MTSLNSCVNYFHVNNQRIAVLNSKISIVKKIVSNKSSQEILKDLIEPSYKNLKEANAEQQDIHLAGEEATNSIKNSCEVM